MQNLKITPGWIAVMAALYYIDPVGVFWPFCAAVLVHEMGHCAALWICRVPIEEVRLNLTGAALETAPMDYRREILCALAGPFASLLSTLLAPWFPHWATISLSLAIFNLLPVPPLDGGRALRAALLLRLDASSVYRIMTTLSVLCAILLAALAIWASVFLQGGLWPVLVAGLLMTRIGICVVEERKNAL